MGEVPSTSWRPWCTRAVLLSPPLSLLLLLNQTNPIYQLASYGGQTRLEGMRGTCHVWDSSTGALLRTITVSPNALLSLASGGDWLRWARENLGVAFAMGPHPRLGAGSKVLQLEGGVVRMILDRL